MARVFWELVRILRRSLEFATITFSCFFKGSGMDCLEVRFGPATRIEKEDGGYRVEDALFPYGFVFKADLEGKTMILTGCRYHTENTLAVFLLKDEDEERGSGCVIHLDRAHVAEAREFSCEELLDDLSSDFDRMVFGGPVCCGRLAIMISQGGCGGRGSEYRCNICGAEYVQKTGGIVATPGGERFIRKGDMDCF